MTYRTTPLSTLNLLSLPPECNPKRHKNNNLPTCQLLFQRSLLGTDTHHKKLNCHHHSLGFDYEGIASLQKIAALNHEGCVNTANFNSTGTMLATGSDDQTVKLWKSDSFLSREGIKLQSTIQTSHSHNIFHVDFSPVDDTLVASCSADGEIYVYEGLGTGSTYMLAEYPSMVNQFCFAPASWNGGGRVLYSANYKANGAVDYRTGGSVDGHDLRSRTTTHVLVAPSSKHIKNVDASPWNTFELAVGVEDEVWFCDVRQSNAPMLKITAALRNQLDVDAYTSLDFFPPAIIENPSPNSTCTTRDVREMLAQAVDPPGTHDISVSSISYSRIKRDLLVAYQGENVYRYSLDNAEQPSIVQAYVGNTNEKTFLKRACFFGPREEYVLMGGDDGNVFCWDADTGMVKTCKVGDGYQDRHGSNGIVNGCCPVPNSLGFVSWGLDSCAKIWAPRSDDDEEDEYAPLVREEQRFDRIVNTTTEVDGQERPTRRNTGPRSLRRLHGSKTVAQFTDVTLAKNQWILRQDAYDSFHSSSNSKRGGCSIFLARTARNREIFHRTIGHRVFPLIKCLAFEYIDRGTPLTGLPLLISTDGFLARFHYALAMAQEWRSSGNELFRGQDGNLNGALRCFQSAAEACIGVGILYKLFLARCRAGSVVIEHDDANITAAMKQLKFAPIWKATSELAMGHKDEDEKYDMNDDCPVAIATLAQLTEMNTVYGQVMDLLVICYLNVAITALRLKLFLVSLSASKIVATADKTNAKALHRMARSYLGLNRFDDALTALQSLAKLPDANREELQKAMEQANVGLKAQQFQVKFDRGR